MDVQKELLENRAQMKMVDAKLKAIISLLSREGILSEEDIEDELDRILKGSQ